MKRTLLLLITLVALTAQAQLKTEIEIPRPKNDSVRLLCEIFEMPSAFVGGNDELYIYLNNHIDYPEALKKKKRSQWIEGRVDLDFEISPRGEVQNVKVTSSPDKRLSEVAKRLISQMPRWKPARKGNRTVTSYYSISIDYNFDSDGNLLPLTPLCYGEKRFRLRRLMKE